MASKALANRVNDQQEKFCQLYVIYWHVGKAGKEAGYSEKYAYQIIGKPHIQERICEIQRESGINMVIDKAQVMRETAYIAYSDVTETFFMTPEQLKQAPENVRRAIKKVKVKRTVEKNDNGEQYTVEILEIEMHSKTECLRLLAQMTGAIDPDDTEKQQRPAFTGMNLIVSSPKVERLAKT